MNSQQARDHVKIVIHYTNGDSEMFAPGGPYGRIHAWQWVPEDGTGLLIIKFNPNNSPQRVEIPASAINKIEIHTVRKLDDILPNEETRTN